MPPEENDPRVFLGTDLRAVHLAPDQGGPGLRVLSVELYADGVIVRYVVVDFVPPSAGDAWKWPQLEIGDDVGTEYEQVGASAGSGDGGPLRGEIRFIPEVPSTAALVTVQTDGGSVSVPIR
jgi:hypothetical protein